MFDGTPRARAARLAIGSGIAISIAVAAGAGAAEDFDSRRGHASARTFAEYCEGDLTAEQRSRFDRSLSSAEAALARGDLETGEAALGQGLSAAYRGGAETAVSIKCLGESPARRWLDARLDLDRQRVAEANERLAAHEAALRVLAIDGGRDALVDRVRALDARRFARACHALEEMRRRIEAERRFGAFLVPDEETLERVATEALAQLEPIAAAGQRDALAREARVFDGQQTRGEREAAEAAASASALAEAFAGPGIGLPVDESTAVLQSRVQRSLEALHEARAWNLDRSTARSGMPESIRARERGDQLMARAEGEGTSLAGKEASYAAAERYYGFGGLDDRAKQARAKRDALEPALRAAREERERAMAENEERLRGEADALRRAAEDMKKSESEREAFEDEADALEDELGF